MPPFQQSRFTLYLNADPESGVRAKSVIDDLVFGPLTNSAEQALRDLGELLGLEASRPDKESKKGKGPEVLWLSVDDASGWGFEAKTDKKERSNYTKEDTGQAHEHRQWLRDVHSKRQVELAFVGRVLPVTSSASPGADLMVIDLGAIRAWRAARRISTRHSPPCQSTQMEYRHGWTILNWPFPSAFPGYK